MVVKIPSGAVAADDDVSTPTVQLLRDLSLLPSAADLGKANGVGAAISGPPDSVAIIEAGATAASKWWAGGIAAAATGWTATAIKIWNNLDDTGAWNQPFLLLSIGLVLSSAAFAIGYLLASDVRGRAAAMVATIEARRDVAVTMLEAAGEASRSIVPATPALEPGTMSPLPSNLSASNGTKHGASAEAGWRAVAVRESGASMDFLLVKDSEAEWVGIADVKFT